MSGTANSIRMRARWLAALAVALLTLGLTAAGSSAVAAPADSGGPYRVQLVYRTGRSLAPFQITVAAHGPDARAMWFATEIHRAGRGWAVGQAGPLSTHTGAPLPTVYGTPADATVPRCPDAPSAACQYPITTDAGGSWQAKPAASSRYYIVSAHDDTVRVTVGSTGWRVKDVAGLTARRVFAQQADATGVNAWGQPVEHFTSATAAGGRYGSVVYAALPCGQTGQGQARISARNVRQIGDVDPEPLQCGLRTTGGSFNYFYSAQQTTWRLDGDATGAGGDGTRLLVLDFPQP